MTRTIVAVSAGLSQPSSTRLLADRITGALEREFSAHGEQIDVRIIELRELATDITAQLLNAFGSPALTEAIDAVTQADALVAVTPVFAASYSGLFKSFFDLFDPEALRDKPVLVAATAGTARHSLVLDYAMRPLFTYLHAQVMPVGVFAATDDFADAGLGRRIDSGARHLAAALTDRVAQPASFTGVSSAAVPASSDVTDFRALLAGQL